MSKTYTDKWIDKNGVTRYFQDADATIKLSGIEAGAQENVIESVSVNNQPVSPDINKNINITIPSAPVQSISKNSSALTPDINGNVDITIPTGDAANKAVDTSISTASESVNLPTSAAVANFVEGKGYITSAGTAANVSGTVAITNGGTGATSASDARTNLGLGTAAEKAVDTSISAASSSINLPTSQAVASFVEGKGYQTIDTTYTFATGSSNGSISVTPSGGSASDIAVKGLDAAAYKDVDTSIGAASTSTKLPTSQAVASFVEGKGYLTENAVTSVNGQTGAVNITAVSFHVLEDEEDLPSVGVAGGFYFKPNSNSSGTNLYDEWVDTTGSGDWENLGPVEVDLSNYVTLNGTESLTNKTINGYTPAAAMAKSVDTSIEATSTSANLPTSQAVAAFVEGKGYITSNAVTSVAGKTGDVTLNSGDVGLGNVGNFKAVSTAASQGLTTAEQENARANIGAGTSNFDGAYSNLSGKPILGEAAAKDVDTSISAASESTKLPTSAAVASFVEGKGYITSNAVTSVAGRTGAVTLTSSDVGLGNVGNFKAVSTAESQGLDSTEQANARANIGAGTSNFDGAYSSLSGTPTLGTAAAVDTTTTLATGNTDVPTAGAVYDAINEVKSAASVKACYEETPALYAHAVNDIIYFDNHFYKVTSAISEGDTVVVGTNISADTGIDAGVTVYVDNFYESDPPSGGSVKLVSWIDGTDEEIGAMLSAYYNGTISLSDVQSVWKIGDTRDITISAIAASGTDWTVGESHRSQTIQMQILDFNHDDLVTSINGKTKALISVIPKDCLKDATVTSTGGSTNIENGYMNSTSTNTGGWNSSARRAWCNNGFYNALPSVFKSWVKEVVKVNNEGGGSSAAGVNSNDYVWLPSEYEVFGTTKVSGRQEGTRYAWFEQSDVGRCKNPKWENGTISSSWWGRSPWSSNTYCFFRVFQTSENDDTYWPGANSAFGIAPACCL